MFGYTQKDPATSFNTDKSQRSLVSHSGADQPSFRPTTSSDHEQPFCGPEVPEDRYSTDPPFTFFPHGSPPPTYGQLLERFWGSSGLQNADFQAVVGSSAHSTSYSSRRTHNSPHVPSGSANVSAAAKESRSGNMDSLGPRGKGGPEKFAWEDAVVEDPNHPDRQWLTLEEFRKIKNRVYCRDYRRRTHPEKLLSPSMDSMDSDPPEQPTEAELEDMYRKNPKDIKDRWKKIAIKNRLAARTYRAKQAAKQSGNKEASGAGHENA